MSVLSINNIPFLPQLLGETPNTPQRRQGGALPPQMNGLYAAKNQTAAPPFETILDYLGRFGIGADTLGQIRQKIDQVVANGADANQVASALGQLLQNAANHNTTNPNEMIQSVAQVLKQIDQHTADAKFKGIGDFLENMGTLGVGLNDNAMLQLQQMVNQTLNKGADPNRLADAMLQVLQDAKRQNIDNPDQVANALVQVLRNAASQAGSADLQSMLNHLGRLGVDTNTLSGLQQSISGLINDGIDPKQIASVMQGVLQEASRRGVTNPNQIVHAIGQGLQQASASKRFGGTNLQNIFGYLSRIGVDANTLAGLEQMMSGLVNIGVDPNQIALVMQQILSAAASPGGQAVQGA